MVEEAPNQNQWLVAGKGVLIYEQDLSKKTSKEPKEGQDGTKDGEEIREEDVGVANSQA